jgi:hypothetical protein
VLLLGSHMLSALLGKHDFRLMPEERLRPDRPLPGTLDHFTLRFRMIDR